MEQKFPIFCLRNCLTMSDIEHKIRNNFFQYRFDLQIPCKEPFFYFLIDFHSHQFFEIKRLSFRSLYTGVSGPE